MSTSAALLAAAGALVVADARTGPARIRALDPDRSAAGATTVSPAVRIAIVAAAAGGLLWAVIGGLGGAVTAVLTAVAVAIAARRLSGRSVARTGAGDLAAAWDLLAVCLRAGLAVPVAVEAAAARLPGGSGEALRRTAGLLALGAGADEAWAGPAALPEMATFGRAAARSAATGAALGRTAAAEAVRLRAELADLAEARAQRAAVRITAPLGLCFLPAFLVLGIAPVVIGLAGEVFSRW
ncbi:type II secretion system F family protein [Pseudonocardia endophytica]|uniref:Type II secretion system (T2SS) protein F n=1 Tax=Pseudonocardia endophytica TaxID=401976 RepID=A0A4R1HZT7_PSEEN|nr:type II secretion system F family protein [Pseudonocardia endophytica]TCK27103.1 type II secretion system (T2SS) protein F [Pseudonocardia endophytica]